MGIPSTHFRYGLSLLILVGFQASVFCQINVTLNPVLDNTLYESSSGSLSDGKGQFLFTGRTNSSGLIRRAILKFDIAATVPAGATITDVSLVMRMDKTGVSNAHTTTLHTVLDAWGEGNSDASANEGGGAPAQSNDVTWIHRFFSATPWNNPGGDFNATASASVAVSTVGNYTWSSAQLITDVQNWLDNPSVNFGWMIKGNESIVHTAKRFVSRENTTVANRPRLVITYTVPCVDPVITSFSATSNVLCVGESTTLTVAGSLNSATHWFLYTEGCGMTSVSSSASGSFSVSPTVTTTYFVRGEGGCVTSGSCESITLSVLADPNASFQYNKQMYCPEESDPTATISGTSGGIFTSTPDGLSINANTGAVDVSASTPGAYTITYTVTQTCTSSSSLPFEILGSMNRTEVRSICEGDNFIFGTQTLTTEGEYNETFQSVAGCDSTVTLTLTVLSLINHQTTVSICEGDSFVFGVQTLTVGGEYSETFQSAVGCDSTVSLSLNVHPVYLQQKEVTICEGESFDFGSTLLDSEGVYEHTFQSTLGCDSTVNLTLHVKEVDATVNQEGLTLTASTVGALYQWVVCDNANVFIDGATNQQFTAEVSGHYAVQVTENGCQKLSECLEVIVVGILDNESRIGYAPYPNPFRDVIFIDLGTNDSFATATLFNSQGEMVREESLKSVQPTLSVSSLSPGIYYVRIQAHDKITLSKMVKLKD